MYTWKSSVSTCTYPFENCRRRDRHRRRRTTLMRLNPALLLLHLEIRLLFHHPRHSHRPRIRLRLCNRLGKQDLRAQHHEPGMHSCHSPWLATVHFALALLKTRLTPDVVVYREEVTARSRRDHKLPPSIPERPIRVRVLLPAVILLVLLRVRPIIIT